MVTSDHYKYKYYYELDFHKPYENINRLDLRMGAGTPGVYELLASDDAKNWRKIGGCRTK